MTHEECLSILLGNSCSTPSEKEGWNEYPVELHCRSFVIIAKPTGEKYHNGERDVYRYQIDSVREG